jgi:hypothetical protein
MRRQESLGRAGRLKTPESLPLQTGCGLLIGNGCRRISMLMVMP